MPLMKINVSATRCQYMYSHKLAALFPYIQYQKQRLYTSYILILARKHVPVPSLGKEINRSLGTYLIKYRNRSVVGDLQPRLEPCPPFSASCQCLLLWGGWGGRSSQTLLSLLPSSSLLCPLSIYLDSVLARRRSSFPKVTPKAAIPLKGERKRRT